MLAECLLLYLLGVDTGPAIPPEPLLFPTGRSPAVFAPLAAEVGNLAYMERLGLWGVGAAFPSFQAFLDSMKRRGITFLEVGAGRQARRWL